MKSVSIWLENIAGAGKEDRNAGKKIKKIKLYGFNNLTKTLSFNMYDICYAKTPQHRREYIEYIDEEYNAERLTGILTEVAKIIGANILNMLSRIMNARFERDDAGCRGKESFGSFGG